MKMPACQQYGPSAGAEVDTQALAQLQAHLLVLSSLQVSSARYCSYLLYAISQKNGWVYSPELHSSS